MSHSRADAVAHRLSEQIDDLARALRAAGAPDEASMRLLELAALAAMHAVELEEVARTRPEPVERAPVEHPERLRPALAA